MSDTAMQQITGYTIKETAFILQVSPKTVYRWCDEGKIDFFKVMGTIRIKKEALITISKPSTNLLAL